jgi:hypothetical protein
MAVMRKVDLYIRQGSVHDIYAQRRAVISFRTPNKLNNNARNNAHMEEAHKPALYCMFHVSAYINNKHVEKNT